MQLFTNNSIVYQGIDIDVIISDKITNLFHRHRQNNSYAKESGGILIGEKRGRYWVVTHATTPKSKDIRNRTLFIRQDRKHIEYYERINTQSKGIKTYIGEWHTHPELDPTPSNTDISSWKSIGLNKGNFLVSIIIGIENNFACYLSERGIQNLTNL